MITVRCQFHPRYSTIKKPSWDCSTCKLLYILRHQHDRGTGACVHETKFAPADTIGSDDWEEPFVGMETGKKSPLTVKCCDHGYKATRKPGWNCDTCWLLFVLKYQNHEDGERRLGSHNPYVYTIGFVDLKEASTKLEVVKR